MRADFFVSAGELLPFVLTWQPSHEPAPAPVDPLRALADTESFWTGRDTAQITRSIAAFINQEAQPCASNRHSS